MQMDVSSITWIKDYLADKPQLETKAHVQQIWLNFLFLFIHFNPVCLRLSEQALYIRNIPIN